MNDPRIVPCVHYEPATSASTRPSGYYPVRAMAGGYMVMDDKYLSATVALPMPPPNVPKERHIGHPKRNKARAKMARESRKRNRT